MDLPSDELDLDDSDGSAGAGVGVLVGAALGGTAAIALTAAAALCLCARRRSVQDRPALRKVGKDDVSVETDRASEAVADIDVAIQVL